MNIKNIEFSFDIVYDIDTLRKFLRIHSEDNDKFFTITKIKKKLKIESEENPFKNWLIFNAFDQKFEIVYGITNEVLRNALIKDREVKELVFNSFLYNDDSLPLCGSHAQSLPDSFILKYCFYRQRLDILAYLLCITIMRYSSCTPKVDSIIFSIGVEDFCKDWIFNILTSVADLDKTKENLWSERDIEWVSKNDIQSMKIKYRFYLAFSSKKIKIPDEYNFKSETFKIENLELNEFGKKNNDMFQLLIEDLNVLKEKIEKIDKWIVGFDLIGNDIYNPFVPYITDEFLTFYKERSKEKKLVFRLNLVNMINEESHKRFYHFNICILFEFLKMLLLNHIDIRLGNGISLCKYIMNFNPLVDEFKKILHYIPIEIDLLNNDLINDRKMIIDFIGLLMDNELPISFINECDGIWNFRCICTNSPHYSILFHYCYIIQSNIISKNDLDKIVINGKKILNNIII